MGNMVIRGVGDTGKNYVLVICQILRIDGRFEFFLAQDHMGLEISKGYPSCSVQPFSAKPYENISYHKGIQGITFLDNRPRL